MQAIQVVLYQPRSQARTISSRMNNAKGPVASSGVGSWGYAGQMQHLTNWRTLTNKCNATHTHTLATTLLTQKHYETLDIYHVSVKLSCTWSWFDICMQSQQQTVWRWGTVPAEFC